jgi:hypothetical protein
VSHGHPFSRVCTQLHSFFGIRVISLAFPSVCLCFWHFCTPFSIHYITVNCYWPNATKVPTRTTSRVWNYHSRTPSRIFPRPFGPVRASSELRTITPELLSEFSHALPNSDHCILPSELGTIFRNFFQIFPRPSRLGAVSSKLGTIIPELLSEFSHALLDSEALHFYSLLNLESPFRNFFQSFPMPFRTWCYILPLLNSEPLF